MYKRCVGHDRDSGSSSRLPSRVTRFGTSIALVLFDLLEGPHDGAAFLVTVEDDGACSKDTSESRFNEHKRNARTIILHELAVDVVVPHGLEDRLVVVVVVLADHLLEVARRLGGVVWNMRR